MSLLDTTKMKKKTNESFKDGWFFTGDVGRWNEDGTLSIIDRKKNIFKLSHGEYVAAEKLEGIYALCEYVSQIWVYGDSTKAALVAVVVPKESFKNWTKKNGIDLYKSAKAQQEMLKALQKTGTEHKVRGFEKIFALRLYPEEFTDKNDLATPTLKLRRHQLKEKFGEEIIEMYEEISKLDEKSGRGTK